MVRGFCAAIVLLVAVQAANAYTFDDVIVEYWAGSGANEAMMVVDFGSGENYAFGYRWDDGETMNRPGGSAFVQNNPTVGTNFSEALLLTVDTAGDLDLTYQYHETHGFGLDEIAYGDNSIIASPAWDPYYPAMWVSGHPGYTDFFTDEPVPAMSPDGENWASSNWGAGTRELADGYWDGWTQGEDFVAAAPVTPTPEPTTFAVLGGLGLIALRRRRA